MAFNVTKATEVPLTLFGGLVTEMAPTDLPEGVSPDLAEQVFTPGATQSRPALARVFVDPFTKDLTYGKSFVDPEGIIRNLWLDAAGGLYVENLSVTPGIKTKLLQSAPGSYAKSITAFGREYIAISDGLLGTEVPLQYDGTNLDRVTQEGPGTPPTVASITIPASVMAVSGAPPVLTVVSITPTGLSPDGTFYSGADIVVSTTPGVQSGDIITIAGNTEAAFNTTFTALTVNPNELLIQVVAYFDAAATTGTGGTLTVGSGTTLQRSGNIVTANTTTAHGLQIGYQAQITGIKASTIGGAISSITINNEDQPGRATIVMTGAHGLVPGLFISIQGVAGATVGGAITAAVRTGQIVTITTSTANKLNPGATVTLAGVADATFNSTVTIQKVISPTKFVFAQAGVDATSSGGTVGVNWPIPDSPTPTYFEVLAAPDPTTFQVDISYSDGVWTTGTVSYAWDGTFYVSAVPSTTQFQYKQYGPDATTTDVGMVTPHGQISPGEHQLRVSFLTRQGYVTRPSPPVRFVANGGQYLGVTDIAIGPSNVIARILDVTGAGGSFFFYIPVPAQVNGQVISTATQVNDNTSTAAVLDFADTTLFAALATSIPGNNTAAQVVLDGALGFGFYGSRLLTYGQRNIIQNLLNMSFEGGSLPSSITQPTGWFSSLTGALTSSGNFGPAWSINVTPADTARGTLAQSFYQDAYGAPIASPDTLYRVRVWLKPSAIVADLLWKIRLISVSASLDIEAVIGGSLMSTDGSFLEADFASKTPIAIPSDLRLEFWAETHASTVDLIVDDLSIVYAENPTMDTTLYGSYVNNPEAFDGESGVFGPTDDTRKVMDFGIVRQTLYVLTQDPSGRLHAISDNGVTEPAGWQVNEIASNCGLLSAFALTRSQADDASAAGGEEWLAWASSSGARIFGGDQPWKISQEIQPNWEAVNPSAWLTAWSLNDPVSRTIYFGLPTGSASAPSLILLVNYRELDTAQEIAQAAPVKIGVNGKLSASDHSRKWSVWNRPMNGGILMYRSPGTLSVILLGGNGQKPGTFAGYGNAYYLAVGQMTDHDYGVIVPYYTTYFFLSDEQEVALQIGSHQKTLAYLTAQFSGVGQGRVTALVNNLNQPWVRVCNRTLDPAPRFDLEWGGASAQGYRMAFKFESFPAEGETDNAFTLQKCVAALRPAAHLPVRGSSR